MIAFPLPTFEYVTQFRSFSLLLDDLLEVPQPSPTDDIRQAVPPTQQDCHFFTLSLGIQGANVAFLDCGVETETSKGLLRISSVHIMRNDLFSSMMVVGFEDN